MYNPDDSENTICKVTAETDYECLMLRIQRFGSLFRHYAKYKGLREEDLEYFFDNNRLDIKDTPNSVQLQSGNTVMVRTRHNNPEPAEPAASDD